MPLCLHQIEKVSFSRKKCCTSVCPPILSYRRVGMLLITRQRARKRFPLLCLHGWFNYFFSTAKCFLDSRFLSAAIRPQMSFHSFSLSVFIKFHKSKNMFTSMKWREELHQFLFDIKPSGISHLQKCCFHCDAFVTLSGMRVIRNHIYHKDQMYQDHFIFKLSFKVLCWNLYQPH